MSEYIRARAPLRIGLAGGGTDVDPYASEYGGCVFNTTINRYAYCTIMPRSDKTMSVHSRYYGSYEAPLDGGPLNLDGKLDLAKAVANYFEIKDGFDMMMHSEAPAGSGLGGSSTMMVALIAAVNNWRGEHMTPGEIAKLAYKLERIDIGLKGGKQDQYAATYGGFNLLEFGANDKVTVTPVKLSDDTRNELQYRSLLCYTGTPRESAKIIESQIKTFKDDGGNKEPLDKSKALARDLCEALKKNDIERAGSILDLSWQYKKQFSSNVTNKHINDLYQVAIDNGAIGGKVSGAGGGGFMYFLCEYDKKPQVAEALKDNGARITDFMFDSVGVTSWRGKNERSDNS